MIKVFVGGIAVGMANIIPGVSGGTMMVILGLFNRVMESISNFFSIHNPDRWKDFKFLASLAAGAVVGIIAFAKLLEFCFTYYPTQTMFCFVGMVAFSIPSLIKKEMKEDKFKILPFAIGCSIIFGLMYLAPSQTEQVLTSFPDIDFLYLLLVTFVGMVAGAAMFLPGVSGSMVLLIIGQYYLFKSLLANATSFRIDILIPLGFIAIGVVIGVVLSSKGIKYCLEHFHQTTMNLILGLVVASSIVLIPLDAVYTLPTIATCILALIGGGIVVLLLEKFAS